MSVLLIHKDKDNVVLDYRVRVYKRLKDSLALKGIVFNVICENVQEVDDSISSEFIFKEKITLGSVIRFVRKESVEKVIIFMNMKQSLLFPIVVFLRLMGVQVIYWGHGRNLQDPDNFIKNILYFFAFLFSSRVLFYSQDALEKYMPVFLRYKSFYANNSIDMTGAFCAKRPNEILSLFGFGEGLNIVTVGRIQPRKRLDLLCEAVKRLEPKGVSLIIIGKIEDDRVFGYLDCKNIVSLGPVYGLDRFDYINSCDLYCIPGTVGLSIIEPLALGKPIMAASGSLVHHSPEIIYLEEGVNGVFVDTLTPEGFVSAISCYLDSPHLLCSQGENSQIIYNEKANLDMMMKGFIKVLGYD